MKILHSGYELELVNGGGKRCYGVSFKKNGVVVAYLTSSFDGATSCCMCYCKNGYDFIQLGTEKVWCKDTQQEATDIQLYNAKRALKTISVNICSKVFCGENGIFTNSYAE